MSTFKTSLVTACVFGMFVATASGQVRLFMVADGEQSTVATTGNTQVTMFPGTSKKIMVWLEDTVQNQELNSYQVILRWAAAPQPGATGSVSYFDFPTYRCIAVPFAGDPCDPLDPSACGGSPDFCLTRGDSVLVDTERVDYVFFAHPTDGGTFYIETAPPPDGIAGYGFAGGLIVLSGGVAVQGITYLGEFELAASADAEGDFELVFVPLWGQPESGTSLGGGTAVPYVVDEIQNLTVSALPAACPNGTVAECCDPDSDGIRNDACVRCRCDTSPECAFENVLFADIGGPFGDCAPDGFCNVHDRNHALGCFSSTTACESLFIDAGGAFGSCVPDGFCNIHDANHALTCFSGTNVCTCPAGPSPTAPPVTVGAARLRVVPEARTVVAGGEIRVRVFVEPSAVRPARACVLPSAWDRRVEPAPRGMQSYQLHLGVSGGLRGGLELIDISIEPRGNYVFASHNDVFDAFNVGTGQMLAGINVADAVTGSGGYLATYTYRAADNAVGTFVVDALYDETAGDQTFLIAPFNNKIDVAGTTPGVISVTTGAHGTSR